MQDVCLNSFAVSCSVIANVSVWIPNQHKVLNSNNFGDLVWQLWLVHQSTCVWFLQTLMSQAAFLTVPYWNTVPVCSASATFHQCLENLPLLQLSLKSYSNDGASNRYSSLPTALYYFFQYLYALLSISLYPLSFFLLILVGLLKQAVCLLFGQYSAREVQACDKDPTILINSHLLYLVNSVSLPENSWMDPFPGVKHVWNLSRLIWGEYWLVT